MYEEHPDMRLDLRLQERATHEVTFCHVYILGSRDKTRYYVVSTHGIIFKAIFIYISPKLTVPR